MCQNKDLKFVERLIYKRRGHFYIFKFYVDIISPKTLPYVGGNHLCQHHKNLPSHLKKEGNKSLTLNESNW